MARHTITLQELIDCLEAEAWHQVACSFGKGTQKSLEVDNKGRIRVTDHKNVAYCGQDRAKAVKAYNEAP